jgi:hypothetical protein
MATIQDLKKRADDIAKAHEESEITPAMVGNEFLDIVDTFDNKLTAETTARQAADTALQQSIASEATARQTAISNEAAARKTADTTLTTALKILQKNQFQQIGKNVSLDFPLTWFPGAYYIGDEIPADAISPHLLSRNYLFVVGDVDISLGDANEVHQYTQYRITKENISFRKGYQVKPKGPTDSDFRFDAWQVIGENPVLPQSDWKQTDAAKPDYIKNKPLVKEINVGALPNNGTKTVPHGIDRFSSRKIKSITGYARRDSETIIPIPYISLDGQSVQLSANSTGITIQTNADMSAFTISYLYIEYSSETYVMPGDPGSGPTEGPTSTPTPEPTPTPGPSDPPPAPASTPTPTPGNIVIDPPEPQPGKGPTDEPTPEPTPGPTQTPAS